MNVTQILFWFLSLLAVGSAIMVIVNRNPVHSILWLIVVFFAISGHYVLLNAQFLAVVNIIVYAGAIMVLFLFVVMLMNLNAASEPPMKNNLMRAAAIVSGLALMLVIIAAVKNSEQVNLQQQVASGGSAGLIKELGRLLFTKYVIPFEISSVLFLSAMIGAVVIAKKDESIVADA
ncbi:MAG: NADH-quinone oxidoreductase subunit J [Ferruginibacter sp.]